MLTLHSGTAGCGFTTRPDTNDDLIFRQVVEQNEYAIDGPLPPNAVVLDIGTHIGSFSYFALTRGAAEVIGYEPDRSNHRAAEHNLAGFRARARVHCAAVWRSDRPADTLPFQPSSDLANTGGGSVMWQVEGATVRAIPFDTAVDAATLGGGRRVHLVKMDCEGAEFPILLTSQLLHRIDRIVGEYHELRAAPSSHAAVPRHEEFRISELVDVLRSSGFEVRWERRATGSFGALGLFFAHRAEHLLPT